MLQYKNFILITLIKRSIENIDTILIYVSSVGLPISQEHVIQLSDFIIVLPENIVLYTMLQT